MPPPTPRRSPSHARHSPVPVQIWPWLSSPLLRFFLQHIRLSNFIPVPPFGQTDFPPRQRFLAKLLSAPARSAWRVESSWCSSDLVWPSALWFWLFWIFPVYHSSWQVLASKGKALVSGKESKALWFLWSFCHTAFIANAIWIEMAKFEFNGSCPGTHACWIGPNFSWFSSSSGLCCSSLGLGLAMHGYACCIFCCE